MKKIAFFLAVSLVTVQLIAQDKVINDANATARPVTGFHGVRISTGIEMVMKQGNSEAVAVSAASAEDRDRIITEVSDGILKIYYKNEGLTNWSSQGRKLKAYVSFKQLDYLHGSSGSSTHIDGKLNTTTMKIDLSSGAGLNGSIEGSSLDIEASSGAVAAIEGKAGTVVMDVSSGAVINGFDLVSSDCNAKASTGGVIEVTVNKELTAKASTGGAVKYKGDGSVTRVSKSTGGSVRKS